MEHIFVTYVPEYLQNYLEGEKGYITRRDDHTENFVVIRLDNLLEFTDLINLLKNERTWIRRWSSSTELDFYGNGFIKTIVEIKGTEPEEIIAR